MAKRRKAKRKSRKLLSEEGKMSFALAMLIAVGAIFINMFSSVMHDLVVTLGGWYYIIYKWTAYAGFLFVVGSLWWIFKKFVDTK